MSRCKSFWKSAPYDIICGRVHLEILNYGENLFAMLESSRERHLMTLWWLYFLSATGPDFDNRVAQLVTYCLLVTRMNMADNKAKVLRCWSFTQYKRINHLSRCCLYAQMTINIFIAAPIITNKHRPYVPRPTDGGSNPVSVMYTADEEHLDSDCSAHEWLRSGTRERSVSHT